MAGVSTTNSSDTADADGIVTVFNFTFFAYSSDNIKVYSVLDDVLTPITSGITVAINLSFIGGTVTFDTAPLDAVGAILIRREVPYTQTTELADLTRYKETALEQALNTLVLQVQQLAADAANSIRYTEVAAATDAIVEEPEDGAVLKYSGTDGRIVAGPTTTEIEDAETNATAAAASASAASTSESSAEDWATKTDGVVASSEFSSKAYAVGGTGVTDTAGKGGAKEWATKTGGTVDTLERSAKAYAQEDLTGAVGGSSKDWAQTAEDSEVTTGLYSALHWAAKAAASAASVYLPTIGTATQLLKVNAGGTALENAAKLPDFIPNKRGTLFAQNADDDGFEAIAPDTAGKFLLAGGDDALPVYTTAATVSATIGSLLYPVGSYYFNETDNTNPATLLGFGTWSAVTDKFIVARGSTYTSTGGAATKSLSSGENGPHTHVQNSPNASGGSNNFPSVDVGADNNGNNSTLTSTASSGSGTSFSIIPPYQAAYCWKRTA